MASEVKRNCGRVALMAGRRDMANAIGRNFNPEDLVCLIRRYFSLVATLLSACAITGTQMQAECESKHQNFSEMYWCTKEAVSTRNPTILTDARAKLYLLRGEQLAQEVDDRKISSLDAKVIWQNLFIELRSGKMQEISASLDSLSKSLEAARASKQRSDQIHCTSNQYGSFVSTNCR